MSEFYHTNYHLRDFHHPLKQHEDSQRNRKNRFQLHMLYQELRVHRLKEKQCFNAGKCSSATMFQCSALPELREPLTGTDGKAVDAENPWVRAPHPCCP